MSFSLFSVEFDEPEFNQENFTDVSPERFNASNYLKGRCKRCGGHICVSPGYCAQCLSTEFCTCHKCMQYASLYRELLDEIYWLQRDYGFEIDEISAKRGLNEDQTMQRREAYLGRNSIRIVKKFEQAKSYKNMLCPVSKGVRHG
ncbi:hypothetical protein P4E94_19325 [Pontiellaceae bacterium B12219]|nr:hypothetical protein [Pontiellaceae bacterium B12219]